MSSAEDDTSDSDEAIVEPDRKRNLFEMTNPIDVKEIVSNGIFNTPRTTVYRFRPLATKGNVTNATKIRKLEIYPSTSSFQRLRASSNKHLGSHDGWMHPDDTDPWSSHQVSRSRHISEPNYITPTTPRHRESHVTLSNTLKALTYMAASEQPTFQLSPFSTMPASTWVDFDPCSGSKSNLMDELSGFVVDKPAEDRCFELGASYIGWPSNKPSVSIQDSLVGQSLPLRQSRHHNIFLGSYGKNSNGETTQSLVGQSMPADSEQMQDSSRRNGNGKIKHCTLPTNHKSNNMKVRCPFYFDPRVDPAVRCQTREKHVSQLIRHLRSHGVYFCGKDSQLFDGSNARDEWDRHNRGTHSEQMCIDYWCASSLPHRHPRMAICKAWHDLKQPERKWMNIFAVTLLDEVGRFPAWKDVCVFEEPHHSPVVSESPSSGSDASAMTIDFPQLDLGSSQDGTNMQTNQQDTWLTLTSAGNPYPAGHAAIPNDNNNFPLPMPNNREANAIQIEGLVHQNTQLQDTLTRVMQQYSILHNYSENLLRAHQQVFLVDPAEFQRPDQLLAWLVNRQRSLVGFPLEDSVQMLVNGNAIPPDGAGPQMRGENGTLSYTNNSGPPVPQPDDYLELPEQDGTFDFEAYNNFHPSY